MGILTAQPRLIVLSGKGGVGKTTLSSALSLQLAQESPQQRLLLVSTDPAHSLGDIWQQPISDTPRSVLANLAIRALDAAQLLEDFKQRYVPALSLIAERASWLEREDLVPLWDLTWPGVDELMALLEINRLLQTNQVDTVILDTAPTGHTLRLLALPDFLDNLLGVFQAFQDKHRAMQRHFTGSFQVDAADQFLVDIQTDLHAGQARLRDPEQTAMWLVMLPEAMSIAETQRFTQSLEQRRISVQGIVVNQLVSAASARFPAQQQSLRQLQHTLGSLPLWGLPWLATEPLGSQALQEMVGLLRPLAEFIRDEPPLPPVIPAIPSESILDQIPASVRLILCGGKGGVGKTTVAASLSYALAARDPAATLLVVSIDPAHSLGDCLGVALSGDPQAIGEHLHAQEVDAEAILAQFRHDYLEDMVAILASDPDQIALNYDALAWQRLLNMPPPGLDEIMALINLLAHQERYGVIIIDSAPTGHLLRFLEMPDALEGWLNLALKLWLKYRDRVGHIELAQRLRSLRQQVKTLHTQLRDPQLTCFITVLNPEQAVLAETQRLMETLNHLGIPHPFAILNRVATDPRDPLYPRHQQVMATLAFPYRVLPFHPDPNPHTLSAYF
ncbi:MAG: arsenical pump-driving ATPase [Synechococcales cyanobacterium]